MPELYDQDMPADPHRGTVYDQDRPYAYFRPVSGVAENSEFLPSDLNKPENSTEGRALKRFLRPKYIGRAVLAAVLLPIAVPRCDALVTGDVLSAEPTHCAYGQAVNPASLSRAQLLAEVESMQFAISPTQYDELSQKINTVSSIQQMNSLLEKDIFSKYGIKVFIDSFPGQDYGWLPQPHDLPLLPKERLGHPSLSQLKTGVNGFMKDTLSLVPAAFMKEMHGSNLYLDWKPYMSIEADASGIYQASEGTLFKTRDDIIVDLSSSELDFDYFHELNHGLQARQCGRGVVYRENSDSQPNFDEFGKLNPKHFQYAYDKSYISKGAIATREGLVVDAYADASPLEDVADTGASLLWGYYGLSPDTSKPLGAIALRKQKLIIDRQTLLEPHIAAYYYYLSQADVRAFPAQTARDDNPTIDCFGNPDTNKHPLTVTYYPSGYSYLDTTGSMPPPQTTVVYTGYDSSANKPVYEFGVLPESRDTTQETRFELHLGENVAVELELNRNADFSYPPAMVGWQNQRLGSTTIRCLGIEP